jgi:hypothetical protein
MPTRPPQHLIFDADDTLWARYGYGTKVFELTLEENVRRLHDGILPAVAAGLRAVFIATRTRGAWRSSPCRRTTRASCG